MLKNRNRVFSRCLAAILFCASLVAGWTFNATAEDPTPPQGTGRIVGTVRNQQDNSPIAGADLLAGNPALQIGMTTHSGPDGHFAFETVPAGGWFVQASAPGFLPRTLTTTVQTSQTVELNIGLEHFSTTPGEIHGKVADKVTSAPLAGALLYIPNLSTSPNPSFAATMSDQDGNYVFPVVPPGDREVHAVHPGYNDGDQHVQVTSGHISILNFQLDPHEQGPGGIAGRVTDVHTHDPIAGAIVEVSGIQTLVPVMTNANGEYGFTGVPPGEHLVNVSKDGYGPAHREVEVESGHVTIADFALEHITTVPPGSIAGFVTDSVTSQPIAGALVFYGPLFTATAPPLWWDDDVSPELPHVVTDAHGHYVIENLRPGTYHLEATAPGHKRGHEETEVKSGLRSEVDFSLEPEVINPPGGIAGLVEDAETSQPIAGARVYFMRVPDDPIEHDDRQEGSTSLPTATPIPAPQFVTTGPDGLYHIDGLPPGHYHLYATKDGYSPQGQFVEVHSGMVTIANFSLHPRPDTHGSVFGRVIDAVTSMPLVGAHVVVAHDGDMTDGPSLPPAVVLGEALTGPNGEYEIPGIPAGEVVVFASHDGYRTGRHEAEVHAGQETRVNFALQPIPIRPKGTIVGTVFDARTTTPLAQAMVTLNPDDESAFELSNPPDHHRYALTDQNGQYAFPDIPVGSYEVTAAKDGYHRAEKHAHVLDGQTTEVDFFLQPRPEPMIGSLAGIVVDAVTSAPIEGAWVALRGDDPQWLAESRDGLITRTNSEGRYEFPHLKAGSYKAHVIKRGYEVAEADIDVPAGPRTFHNFALTPLPTDTGAIEGIVTDAITNDPIAEAIVFVPLAPPEFLFMSSDDTALSARTDANGHYRIEGVPVGMRTVVAFRRGYFTDAQLAQVPANGTVTVDFALVPLPAQTQTLVVQAINASTGRPIPNARVHISVSDWLQPFTDWDPYWGKTDVNGNLVLNFVPVGGWSIVGSVQGYRPVVQSLRVVSGSTPPRAGAGAGQTGQAVVLSFQQGAPPNQVTDWRLYN